MKFDFRVILFSLLFVLTACLPSARTEVREPDPSLQPSQQLASPSPTPFLPPTSMPTTVPQPNIMVGIPTYWQLNDPIVIENEKVIATSDLTTADCMLSVRGYRQPAGEVILALVVPFNTILDGLTMVEILKDWAGTNQNGEKRSYITIETIKPLIEDQYSPQSQMQFATDSSALIDQLYANPGLIGLLPFEDLTPALKVLNVDGISPYDQQFDALSYPLTLFVGYSCSNPEHLQQLEMLPLSYSSNRRAELFTSVLITGTTALTRAIGAKMETNGMSYPGLKIKDWFDQADITHISNEVSFNVDCPPANPNQTDLLFCSRPEYLDLFTFLEIDVVELTGNHLTDKGVPALENTFDLLTQNEILYYAAGRDPAEAEKAARFDLNGNKISFLGCNQAGPTFVWVTDTRSGVLRCDMDRMQELVAAEVAAGYLPIFTFQYGESFQFEAFPPQRNDFRAIIEAGAVIVSGSQAHLPMSMEIYKERFIHYGLGNLFFDQMDIPVVGTRREFLDRHIFYNGQYLGVQLLTAMLEDYSQPRPMSQSERSSLLEDAFEYFQRVEGR